MLNKLIAIIRKDILIRFSGRTELLFFLVLPIIFTVIVGGGIPDEDDARLLLPVVDQDGGEQAEAFLAALARSESVRADVVSQAEAEELFDENDAGAYVVIPAGFSEGLTASGLLAGGQSELVLRVASGSNIGPAIEQEVARAASAQARPLQIALQSVGLVESIAPYEGDGERAAAFERALAAAEAGAAAGQVSVEYSAIGADDSFDASAQSSAGNLISWVFIPLLGASGLFVFERVLGTLERQMTTPTRKSN
jgi:ABC-2 type transport system permease protein